MAYLYINECSQLPDFDHERNDLKKNRRVNASSISALFCGAPIKRSVKQCSVLSTACYSIVLSGLNDIEEVSHQVRTYI